MEEQNNFGLSEDAALRFELPTTALRDAFLSYVVLDAQHTPDAGTTDWMLPGWAQIWIIISELPIAVQIGNRLYDPMPTAALYGVTSYAMPVVSHGGVTVGIYLSPIGWARLFKMPARGLRDQVYPLEKAMHPTLVAELLSRLRAFKDASEVKGILDDFFTEHFSTPHPKEPLIARLMAAIIDATTSSLGDAVARQGIARLQVQDLANQFFGLPAKTLQVRNRFLTALVKRMAGRTEDYSAAASLYFDLRHFNRDAQRFLRMTAARFVAQPMPYLRAALLARDMVMKADAKAAKDSQLGGIGPLAPPARTVDRLNPPSARFTLP